LKFNYSPTLFFQTQFMLETNPETVSEITVLLLSQTFTWPTR